MEDLAIFTALNHSGSFGKNFVKFKKQICDLSAIGRSVWRKTVTSQPANNIYISYSFIYYFCYIFTLRILHNPHFLQSALCIPRFQTKSQIWLLCFLRVCLHGGGGPQVGEVTRLGGVTRLSI